MSNIVRLITTEESTVDADRAAMGERNDCAVKAITLTTGLPYRQVHEALRLAGRRNRCGTYIYQSDRAIEALGFEMRAVRFHPCTTRTVAHQLPKTGRFMVRVSRHALAVVDGKVCDWTDGRLKRVKEIYEIVRVGAPAPKPVIQAIPTVKPAAPIAPTQKVVIDFGRLRELLRERVTVETLIAELGGTNNQIRGAIDALRRRGANIQNVARNTFQLI